LILICEIQAYLDAMADTPTMGWIQMYYMMIITKCILYV